MRALETALIHPALLLAALVVCPGGAGCKSGSKEDRATAGAGGAARGEEAGRGPSGAARGADATGRPAADRDAAPGAAALLEERALVPDWRVRIPGAPGLRVLQASAGPVLIGDVLVVGSTAIGFAALDSASGEVRWQRRGEERPGRPALVGDEIWLPGRCAHVADGVPDAPVLGCVERVRASDGHLTGRLWVVVPRSVAPDVRAHALAATDDGALLWAGGGRLWQIRADGATSQIADAGAPVLAAAEAGTQLWTATENGLSALGPPSESGEQPGARAAVWRVAFSESVAAGLAGPVAAGSVVAWVRDGVLEARRARDGKGGWTAEGRYAYVPGSLRAAGDSGLLAVAVDGGISPARVDAATGRRSWRGERVPGIQVLAADFASAAPQAGELAVVVRLEPSLLRDAVVLFGGDGRVRGAWPLPEPERVRADPPGLAVGGGAAYLLYDGRIAARLSAPAH